MYSSDNLEVLHCAVAGGLHPPAPRKVGLQIVGRAFSEPTLLRIANAYQTHTDWHNQAPDLSGS